MSPNEAKGMTNSVVPNQTAPDLGLRCLPRHMCPETKDHYGMFKPFLLLTSLRRLLSYCMILYGIVVSGHRALSRGVLNGLFTTFYLC